MSVFFPNVILSCILYINTYTDFSHIILNIFLFLYILHRYVWGCLIVFEGVF